MIIASVSRLMSDRLGTVKLEELSRSLLPRRIGKVDHLSQAR